MPALYLFSVLTSILPSSFEHSCDGILGSCCSGRHVEFWYVIGPVREGLWQNLKIFEQGLACHVRLNQGLHPSPALSVHL